VSELNRLSQEGAVRLGITMVGRHLAGVFRWQQMMAVLWWHNLLLRTE
jgi:hypothetical protein